MIPVLANEILGLLNLSGEDIGQALITRIASGGDKKRRLERVEMLGIAAVLNTAGTLRGLGKIEPPESAPAQERLLYLETACALQGESLKALCEVVIAMVRAADLDGSSEPAIGESRP